MPRKYEKKKRVRTVYNEPACFHAYCELGPARSLAKLADSGLVDVCLRQLETWSSAHDWVKRALEYDEDEYTRRKAKQDAAIDRMLEAQADSAERVFLLAEGEIARLIEAKRLGGQATVTLYKTAGETWARALGQATQRLELTGNQEQPIVTQSHVLIDLRKCSNHELELLEQIAAKQEGQE